MISQRRVNWLIAIISVAVPVLVAVLFYMPAIDLNIDISFFPKFHAALNSCVAVLLVTGFVFIRRRNVKAHRACMMSAFSLSALFLISYVIYHSASESTAFGGEGIIRYVYYFILGTHIILAAIIMPFILITMSRALTFKFDKHRKIARITFPLWLYVAVTGVIVYFMIAPYYE
jgi:putative membrane protein